ncbi:MAG: hypothetical protein RJA76_2133, partial [Bacteroidota bacterium]
MSRIKQNGIWEIMYMLWMGIIPLSSSIALGYFGFRGLENIRNYNLNELL